MPDTSELALGDGTWELRAVAPSFWSDPVYVRQGERARIVLWPIAELGGTASGLSNLRVRFAALDDRAPSGESVCTIAGDAWRCAIPAAGRYDLTFTAHGYAPEFRRGMDVIAPELDLGHFDFAKGASLSGRLALARGVRVDVAGAEVSLAPAGGGTARVAKATPRGFFQFRGVSSGEYIVRASKSGLTSASETVKIIDGAAAELAAPLLLDTPKRIDVSLLPFLDPAGAAWHVALLVVHGARVESIVESAAEGDGRWSRRGLLSGEYRIEIRTGAGAFWLAQPVTVGADDLAIPIAVLPLEISGTLRLGDRPLAAVLSFGGEGGVELKSGDDGRFGGAVPPPEADGEWTILIDSTAPDIHRTVKARAAGDDGARKLAITLPFTTLLGRVRNEDGSAEPSAILAIHAISGRAPVEQAFVGSDGRFQLAGFDPGEYDVTAEAFQRSSDVLRVSLTSDIDPPELDIVLHKEIVVRGRIVAGDMPIIGARIVAFPRTAPGTFLPDATSDGNGRFELSLPPGTTVYDIFAVHPAFDVISARMRRQPDKLLLITTQQTGGTLAVDAPAAEIVQLRHDGAELPMRWAAETSRGSVDVDAKRQRLVMKRLEAGHYSACIRGICVSGYVPPFGTLNLSVEPE